MTQPPLRRLKDWALLLGLASCFLAVDQLSKWLIVRNLAANESWAPIPALARIFTFTHVQNTGVSFGQLRGLGWIFMLVNLAVLIAVVAYYPRIRPGQDLLRLASALLVGGDLGNVIDRMRSWYRAAESAGDLWAALPKAYVTDFMDFRIWPVFNVADMCVVSGVIIVAWVLWRGERAQAQKQIAGGPAAHEP